MTFVYLSELGAMVAAIVLMAAMKSEDARAVSIQFFEHKCHISHRDGLNFKHSDCYFYFTSQVSNATLLN